mmetsp:Transcript_96921/g.243076  ORF Transcript_96921/g.243076 Transcript_96921/m.243076 type:complete len:203 (-) Transcript_96921:619-1227(-)
MGSASNNLQIHHGVFFIIVLEPSNWLVKGEGVLSLLARYCFRLRLSLTLCPLLVVIRYAFPACLVEDKSNLNSASSAYHSVLPMRVALIGLGRQLYITMAKAQVVLLRASFFEAVRARELPAYLAEALLRLGGDHHARGFLVQPVAATSLRECAIPAHTASAFQLVLLILPILSRPPCILEVVLQREVLMQLDLRLVTVQQH